MEPVLEGVQPSDHQWAVENLVVTIVVDPQPQPFTAENLADEHPLALELQIAFIGDPAYRDAVVVLHLRKNRKTGSA